MQNGKNNKITRGKYKVVAKKSESDKMMSGAFEPDIILL